MVEDSCRLDVSSCAEPWQIVIGFLCMNPWQGSFPRIGVLKTMPSFSPFCGLLHWDLTLRPLHPAAVVPFLAVNLMKGHQEALNVQRTISIHRGGEVSPLNDPKKRGSHKTFKTWMYFIGWFFDFQISVPLLSHFIGWAGKNFRVFFS